MVDAKVRDLLQGAVDLHVHPGVGLRDIPITVAGGVALNNQVGGLNPYAAEKVPRAEVVDVAGFDLAICDMEHGQVTEAGAREVILPVVDSHCNFKL